MKFPSFKTAPAAVPPQTLKAVQQRGADEQFRIDSKPDAEFFRYGHFKDPPIAYERPQTEDSEAAAATTKAIKKVVPEVKFMASDAASMKRLSYCIEEDGNGNVLFNPEILNVVSNEKALQAANMCLVDVENVQEWIDCIDSCVDENKAVEYLEAALERFLNNQYLHSMSLYFGLEVIDFESFKVLDHVSKLPLEKSLIYLYESGYTERLFRNLGIQISVQLDAWPQNIPKGTPEELLVEHWLRTEHERSFRFYLPFAADSVLIDDPFEEEPERSPDCCVLALDERQVLEFVLQSLTGSSLPELSKYSGLAQLDISSMERLILESYAHLSSELTCVLENKVIYCARRRELENMLSSSDHCSIREFLTSQAYMNPSEPFIVCKFVAFEASFESSYRVRQWIFTSWSKIKLDATFLVFLFKLLCSYFPNYPLQSLIEKSLRLHYSDARIWLYFLDVARDVTSIAYRAVNALPHHKGIYLKAIASVPDVKDKLTLIHLMELKGVRMRTFLEEFVE